MKLLSLHCDYIKYEAGKKALKTAELEKGQEGKHEIKEPLVILTAVEKGDNSSSVLEYVKNIKDIASQVKAKKIVIYPYAHLSSQLASPDIAVSLLREAESLLKKEFEVTRAPFGFYKEFELKCKGHPLAELSREIGSGLNINIIKDKAGSKELVVEEKYDAKQLLNQIARTKLDTSKLKDNDHRILGMKMDLFSFHDTAPGMCFWHNNGWILFNELVNFWRDEHRKAGYQEISTPQILDKKLWQISGHWEKYKENIFLSKYEGRDFAVKQMNCPGGMLVYKASPKSYKELPLRVAELGVVHRQELSGVLAGLFRVIRITQDDAHIFCADESQIEQEIEGVIKMINLFYKKFNLIFDHVELSTRPEKRIGTDAIWDMAEGILEKVLKKNKMKYKINKGDGAFYGPKIDFHIKDSQSRTWQLSTIQLDFAMPERFALEYTDKDNKIKQPIMLHRVIYGSLERFIGILLEHMNGKLPTWLSPIQVRIINFTDRNTEACKKLIKQLEEKIPNLRVDADFRNDTVQSKIRDAEILRVPNIIVIGDKEESSKSLALRKHGKVSSIKIDKFIEELAEEIRERK